MKTVKRIHSNQQGMALVMAIVFLLILTVLGIAAMNSSVFSEKMTQNMKDMTGAFQAAESALGDGEKWLGNSTSVPLPVSTCTSPPCSVWTLNSLGSTLSQQTTTWWQSNAQAYSASIPNAAIQPMYIIELFNFVPYDLSPNSLATGKGYYYYRVTARGIGSTPNAVANVQSIYATKFN
jgi:type IV pilus assembly protein PilX